MDNLEEAKKYIYSIDFSKICSKMESHLGWIMDDVLDTCHQYRNYLFLKKKYPEFNLPPSKDIDLFWHEHILDTNKYIEDTSVIFGGYLHHYPYFGIDNNTTIADVMKSFQMTQELYLKEFNTAMSPTRSQLPSVLYSLMYKFKKISKSKFFMKKRV